MYFDDTFSYLHCIQEFKEACQQLPISTTPKLHILYHHVGQFIQQTRKPLGLFSEQSAESLHHDFEGQWNGRFKRDMSHPDYQSQLLNCVVEYNSKHI